MRFDSFRGRGALTCAAAALALALSSCSSSSSDSNGGSGGTETPTGVYLDGAVLEGLDYSTETHSGTTDADGTFEYEEGETVTFSIGDFPLGEAEGAEVVTAWDLAQNEDAESVNAFLNRIVLVQAIDDDFDLSTGILIPDSAREALQGETFVFTSDDDIFEVVATAGGVTEFAAYVIDAIENNALDNFVNAMDVQFDYPIATLSPEQGQSGVCTFYNAFAPPAVITFSEAMDSATFGDGNALLFDLVARTLYDISGLLLDAESAAVWNITHSVAPFDGNYLLVLTRNIKTAAGDALPAPFFWYSGSNDDCL